MALTKVHNRMIDGADVNVKDFGAVGDGVADDTAAIQAALTSGASEVFIPDGTYLISNLTSGSAITVNNLNIIGTGTILCTTAGIELIGNNNRVEGITIKRATKSTSLVMIYINYGLGIYGDNNHVKNIEVYNMNGPGISIGGKNNTVSDVYSHDNIAGMISNNTTRNLTVSDSRFIYNDVVATSGADGILCSRTNVGVTISNCDLSYNSEHGLYFQGQNGIFVDNRVFGNTGDGLKFGSYDDQGYSYGGETLDTWVQGKAGTPGYNGVDGANGWGLRSILISNNIIQDNTSGIYFQPSAKDVVIEGNILNNNSIRVVYFNYTGADARLEDNIDFSIKNNKVFGTNSFISTTVYQGLVVDGNEIDEYIFTYAPNAATEPRLSERSQNILVKNNVCSQRIEANRASSPTIEANRATYIATPTNSSDIIVKGNTLTAQEQSFDTARIAVFNANNVVVVGNIAFNSSAVPYSFPKEFIGNTIVGNSFTSNYFVDASFNANRPDDGRFCNNYIECTSSARPVYAEGQYSVISNNVIIGTAASDYGIDHYGDNCSIIGNVVVSKSIQLRNDSANIVVGNKCSSVTGVAGTNIIANNG